MGSQRAGFGVSSTGIATAPSTTPAVTFSTMKDIRRGPPASLTTMLVLFSQLQLCVCFG